MSLLTLHFENVLRDGFQLSGLLLLHLAVGHPISPFSGKDVTNRRSAFPDSHNSHDNQYNGLSSLDILPCGEYVDNDQKLFPKLETVYPDIPDNFDISGEKFVDINDYGSNFAYGYLAFEPSPKIKKQGQGIRQLQTRHCPSG